MYGIRCYYRINRHAVREQAGILWSPRFETIEEALIYAQKAVKDWGYDPNDIRVVKI